MSELDAMLSALDQLERTRNRLGQLSSDNAEGWKRQYIALRRELQVEFAAFNKACDAWLASGVDGTQARRLRELIGAFRTRVAGHQARFTVVSIDPADRAYQASMKAVDLARHDLAAFVRSLRTAG